MTGQPFLEFRDVECRRGGRALFRGLNFTVQTGDALVLSGPNGIGKTSLLRLAAGLLQPLRGQIEVTTPTALMTHDLALDEGLSLEDALGFWSRLDGYGADDHLILALEAVGLAHLAQVPVRYLSSGQRRRAAMARVIAQKARLWLLDEPGVGLDTQSVARLSEVIEEHRACGGAVVVSTHMDLHLSMFRTLNPGDFR